MEMRATAFRREGTLFRSDIEVTRPGEDKVLHAYAAYAPTRWQDEPDISARVWEIMRDACDSARQMYMSTTRGLPAHAQGLRRLPPEIEAKVRGLL